MEFERSGTGGVIGSRTESANKKLQGSAALTLRESTSDHAKRRGLPHLAIDDQPHFVNTDRGAFQLNNQAGAGSRSLNATNRTHAAEVVSEDNALIFTGHALLGYSKGAFPNEFTIPMPQLKLNGLAAEPENHDLWNLAQFEFIARHRRASMGG